MPLAAAHRTHIVRVSLIVVVHVAIVEIDFPRVVGVVGVSSTGPVVVGLPVQKNVRLLNCLGARGPYNKGTNPCILIPYR